MIPDDIQPIPGYPGYCVSRDGRVWSDISGRFLTPQVHRRGYLFVPLKLQTGKQRNRYIHRLVALTYIPNPENKPQVNHIDGDKKNNHWSNLEWVSNLENAHHAIENNLMPHNVVSEKQVHDICEKLEQGISVMKISKDTGIPYFTISAIRLGRNWKHISSQYVIPLKRVRKDPLTEEQIRMVCNYLENGLSVKQISHACAISADVIRKICKRQSFLPIVEQYNLHQRNS